MTVSSSKVVARSMKTFSENDDGYKCSVVLSDGTEVTSELFPFDEFDGDAEYMATQWGNRTWMKYDPA